jgi:hypothetical protein
MKNNRIYLYGAILVVLGVIAYFLTSEKGPRTTTEKTFSEQFFKVDSSLVDRLEFDHNGKKYVFSKVSGFWRLTDPIDYPLNQDMVANAVSNIKSYELASIVSTNPARKDSYGFNDTTYTKVTVYQGGTNLGTILIGNSAGGASQTFLKSPNSDEIYLAENFLYNNFIKPSNSYNDWRDLLILSIPSANINSIEYIGPENFTLVKDSTGNFSIGGQRADSSVVGGVLNLLGSFNTQTFEDTPLPPDTKFTNTVKINWDKVTELNFLKIGDSTDVNYLLKVSGNNQIFKFNKALAVNILKTKAEFLGTKQ